MPIPMNSTQRTHIVEVQAIAARLARDFTAADLDAFDDHCNLIIGTMQELRRDLVEQIESSPPSMTLAALMEAGRLPVLVGGESPSD